MFKISPNFTYLIIKGTVICNKHQGAFQLALVVKNRRPNARDIRDASFIPGLGGGSQGEREGERNVALGIFRTSQEILLRT